jgi:DNA adenine methylase
MRFVGGKYNNGVAKQIAPLILKPNSSLIWEPFAGGLSVSLYLAKLKPETTHLWSSDICHPLVSLYQAVQEGFTPPTSSSKEEYLKAKLGPDSDPLKAFYGFALSFSGKWFGGYTADTTERRFADEASRSIVRYLTTMGNSSVDYADFLATTPHHIESTTIYCDPPYRNTQTYAGIPSFDHDLFFQRCQQWADHGCHVFISEQDSPIGTIVWQKQVASFLGKKQKQARPERLYYLEPKGAQ